MCGIFAIPAISWQQVGDIIGTVKYFCTVKVIRYNIGTVKYFSQIHYSEE